MGKRGVLGTGERAHSKQNKVLASLELLEGDRQHTDSYICNKVTGKGKMLPVLDQEEKPPRKSGSRFSKTGEQKVGRLRAEGRLAWRKNYLEASAPGPQRVRTERQGSRQGPGKTVAKTGF